MNPQISRKDMLAMVRAMKVYGGSFVVALSECFILADTSNLSKLFTAFPEIVIQYSEMARHLPNED